MTDHLDAKQKALQINLDKRCYGTFAEIGAGQEVAAWFFRAGGAAGTVAKTMSAYDMTVSDAIYGQAQRYVSRERIMSMLTHEYDILLERLHVKRGATTHFFALANTVRARGYQDKAECHGWMGLRYQTEPGGEPHDILIHVRLLDETNREQSEALGILGVNLLYAMLFHREKLGVFCRSLLDNLSRRRVEVDMLKFHGDRTVTFEDRLCALQLVQSGLTDAALFGANGEIWQAGDVLYKRPIFLKRGTFDPVTLINLDMLEKGAEVFAEDFGDEAKQHLELCEITMHNLLTESETFDHSDFIARAEVLQALGKNVLVSKYAEFHRLSAYLARHTKMPVGIVLGLPLLEEIFLERWYEDLDGGILEAFGRLFKNKVRLYIYPSGDPMSNRVRTLRKARVSPHLQDLLEYLVKNEYLREIPEGLNEFIFTTSASLRQMIRHGDPSWQSMVPEEVLTHGKWVDGAAISRRVSQTD